MKVRSMFISNSSTSSYIISANKNIDPTKLEIRKNLLQNSEKYVVFKHAHEVIQCSEFNLSDKDIKKILHELKNGNQVIVAYYDNGTRDIEVPFIYDGDKANFRLIRVVY